MQGYHTATTTGACALLLACLLARHSLAQPQQRLIVHRSPAW